MESAAAAVSQPGVPAGACPWANLPTDLLLDISGRLNDACDYVRFNSVCQPWRDAALSLPSSRRKFPPWLISLQDGRIMGRISSDATFTRGRRSYSGKVLEGSLSDKSWVAGADGEAICLFTGGPQPTLHDFVTGAVTRLTAPWNDNYGIEQKMRKLCGVVYGDGTIFLYSFVSKPALGQILENTFFTAAILRPGDMAWTVVKKTLDCRPNDNNRAAYHDGKVIVLVNTFQWCVVIPHFGAMRGDDITNGRLEMSPNIPNITRQANYVLESHDELLWVSVSVMHGRLAERPTMNSLANALVVKVHALEEQTDAGSNKMRWVERDGRSFDDRVLFLGLPVSFAAKSTELDMEGGCAYFFYCYCLLKSNLSEGGTKLIDGPFSERGDGCLWLRPQPVVAPIAEIQERVQIRNN